MHLWQELSCSGGATISSQNSLLPYMVLLGTSVLGNAGRSNYHPLQFRMEHSYSNGLQMLFTYT